VSAGEEGCHRLAGIYPVVCNHVAFPHELVVKNVSDLEVNYNRQGST
jgi:hypothetical protein